MQPGGCEGSERIIHKAVLSHPAQARECWATDAYPKMGAKTQAVGPGVTGVSGTFIQNLQVGGIQCAVQSGFKRGSGGHRRMRRAIGCL